MKSYETKEKEVNVGGRNYTASFPAGHSTLKGIIYRCWDANAHDSYANILNYHTNYFVLRKGRKEWEQVYSGSSGQFDVNNIHLGRESGLFHVLFAFEADRVREEIFLRNEYKYLKEESTRINAQKRKVEKRMREIESIDALL